MPDRPPGIPSGPEPAPVPPAIELPATFGKYFLTEKLATGGMAEIYLAKLVGPGGFEKQLVIKQIHPRLSGQRHFVDLFVAEAKILVTLAHGNVVPVYELGVIDDTYFIAMEYIDGPTLYRLTETLRRRGARMAPPLAAWVTARILEGLDYAHRKGEGVIHRDLSPRNVMLSRDGEVKLVDFGIAVTLGDGDADDAGQSAPTGSFPYMSPEQVRKEPLTGQTDLFSVGVLLWEMLVGHRLFARSDPDATLRAVVDHDIPRPSAENPDVPSRLDDVVMRALDRDLTARWPSAADMLAALQRYLYGLDDTPGPRDVAALVARYCPPETRRLPTHHDELDAEVAAELTRPRARTPSAAPLTAGDPPRPGPATAVIPRDGAAPRGKRGPRARTETFATHVELEHMLEKGGPRRGDDHGPRDRTGDERGDDDRARPRGRNGDDRGDDDRDARDRNAHERGDDDRARPRGRNGDDRGDDDRDARDRNAHERGDQTPARPRAARVNAEVDASEPTGEPHPFAAPGTATAAAAAAAGESAVRDGTGDAVARPELPPLPVPGRNPPSMALLIVAALGALVLGGAAIFVFFQGRGAVERGSATRRGSAAGSTDDTNLAGTTNGSALPVATSPDASPPDAAEPDASASPDAPPVPPRDAGATAQTTTQDAGGRGLRNPPRDAAASAHPEAGTHPARPDAHDPGELTARPDAGAAHPTATATLTIGAIPWGTVLLDGKPIGRTPLDRLSVPAGHHVVSVTFGGEDPPRTQSYPIDLGAGEAKQIVADFTRP